VETGSDMMAVVITPEPIEDAMADEMYFVSLERFED
jgi:hypothetical protein